MLPISRILRPSPTTGCFLILFLGLIVTGRTNLFRDPGTFWHIRTGEIILSGRFINHDPFTFTHQGGFWAPYSWLGEVGMAAVHALGGFDALLVMSAALIAGVFTFLFVRIQATGLHWSVAVGVVLLAVAASAGHFHARPHLISLAIFSGMFAFLLRVDGGKSPMRSLWWLVPMLVVWANIHGAVLAGYGTIALALLGWSAFRVLGLPSPIQGSRDWWTLVSVGSVIAVTPIVNPYGLGVPRTWLDIMTMRDLPRIIKEHSPVDPSEPSSWGFFLVASGFVVALAGIREKPRVMWLLPLVWFTLGCQRVRHEPLFAVAAVLAFADFFPATVWARKLLARPDLYDPPAADSAGNSWAGVGPMLVAVAIALAATAFGTGFSVGRLDPQLWPVELLPAMHQEVEGKRDVPIFNEYEYGGFVIYFTPEYRPFVDDRCEVFGNDWLVEFVEASVGDAAPAMAKWEAMYPRFDYALVGERFGRYFSAQPDWEVVASDGTATFYRRKRGVTSR